MARLGTPPAPGAPAWGEVVVLGDAGAGKSALINALLPAPEAASGVGAAVTTDVARYLAPAHGLVLWDTPGFSYGGPSPVAQLRAILDAIRDRGGAPTVAWYAWAASSVRLTRGQRDILDELHARGVAILAVLTKAHLSGHRVHLGDAEFASVIATAGLPLALPQPFLVASLANAWAGFEVGGLTELVGATHRVLSPGAQPPPQDRQP